ncbi:hypothetical protein ACTFIV_000459 [Dictyostelium citrinum]
MAHNNDKDITLLLGKKLLMGWSMLNDVCKDCKIVPLVENKKDNIILCVSCDRQLKRDGNGEIFEEKKLNSSSTPSSSSSTTTTPSSSNSSTPIPTTTIITNITKPQQQTIKNDTKQIDTKYYNDDAYFDDYEDEDDTPLTEEEKIAIEKRLKKSDEFSSKMGEFLLKGWSLLSDSCPNNECYGVPLMKDREKKFYCVSCKMSGLEIEDLIQKLPSANSTETPTTSPTTTTTTSNPIKSKTPTTPLKPTNVIEKEQIKESQPQHLIRPTITTTNPTIVENITPIKNTLTNNSTFSPPYPEPDQKKQRMTGTTPQKLSNSNNQSFLSTTSLSSANNTSILNDEIQELPDFTDNTLSILFEKLKDAQNQLVTTNNIHYCSLIREYTSTISSLLELKKHWTM